MTHVPACMKRKKSLGAQNQDLMKIIADGVNLRICLSTGYNKKKLCLTVKFTNLCVRVLILFWLAFFPQDRSRITKHIGATHHPVTPLIETGLMLTQTDTPCISCQAALSHDVCLWGQLNSLQTYLSYSASGVTTPLEPNCWPNNVSDTTARPVNQLSFSMHFITCGNGLESSPL